MVLWRLIIDEGRDPYMNMAIDEAMLILRERGDIPNTVRIYWFKPSSVTIGYFQKVKDSVNEEYLVEKGIPFTRRITGGGSVYHDENGELVYAIVASLRDFPSDPIERYRTICMGIVYGVEKFGLKAEFKPINDVVVNNKKVSGSAQTWRKNAFLQHGTFMYATDLEALASCLKAPKEKLVSHGAASIRDRVTTVSLELGRVVSREEAVEALVQGFTKALNVNFFKDNLSERELELARGIYGKYSSKEWIYRR